MKINREPDGPPDASSKSLSSGEKLPAQLTK